MELMDLWIEEVWELDDMRASHNDLLSVQKGIVIYFNDSWETAGVTNRLC